MPTTQQAAAKARLGQKHPAYSSMLAASEGFLVRFTMDLYRHDATVLADLRPGDAFSWIVHDSGTHMARANLAPRGFSAPSGSAQFFGRMVADAFRGQELRCYFWDGHRMWRARHAEELDAMMAAHEELLASITKCPLCCRATHASESDDLDRCGMCAEAGRIA
jgi:hypothetical protein